MNHLDSGRTAIIAKAPRARVGRALTALLVAACVAGCYPRYDWRDYRPDCSRGWCGFVASFPGKPTSATRDIPVGAMRLPLAAAIVSVGDVSFAVLSFDLVPGSDPRAARAVLDKKLLDDVGATAGRRGRTLLHAADRSDVAAETVDADGERGGQPFRASARFAERRGRLVEILVLGPIAELSKDSGRQAVETFFTSLRLD